MTHDGEYVTSELNTSLYSPGNAANIVPYYQNYRFFLQKGMGYGLLKTYGLWYANPRPPSWWTEKVMGFQGLWVI